MKLRKLITVGALASVSAFNAWGSVFFTVDVGSLRDETGTALVDAGTLYLVSAGADENFSLPEAGSVIRGDDSIVTSWDLSAESSTQGEYIVSSGEVMFDESWNSGDDLAILWFPNLGPGELPAASEPYGFYRNTSTNGNGDSWEMPEDGTLLHSLKFFIDAENPLVDSGDVPAIVAAAGFGAGDTPGDPVAPTSVATDEDDPGTVNFEWVGADAPGGAFRVERRLEGGSDWTVLGTAAAGTTSWEDSTVGRGKDYEYRLIAINGFDAVSSATASIQSLRSSLHNISTRGVIGSGDNVLIVGFTVQGTGDIELLARTKGPELAVENAQLEAADVAVDPKAFFQFTAPDEQINDDWAADQLAEITALFSPRTDALPYSSQSSLDSAMALTINGSKLSTIISVDEADDGKLGLVEVFDATEATPNDAANRIVNLSTRGFIGTGDQILIGGFIVKGQVSSKLLIRGVGPSLGLPEFNGPIAGRITDPQLWLFTPSDPANPIVVDDWEDNGNAAEISTVSDQVGATNFQTASKDSALLIDATPGLYTVFMFGVNEDTGIGLVEVFLAD